MKRLSWTCILAWSAGIAISIAFWGSLIAIATGLWTQDYPTR
jgi:hypothetical protein